MIYITGDKHGDFGQLKTFCQKAETTVEDILIILGDAGINYFTDWRDTSKKDFIKKLPITLFCIHGNHELRPQHLLSYKEYKMFGGKVYIDKQYPNQIFAVDGEVYGLEGQKTLVIGGAYSVDKYYRIAMGHKWFEDEQPSEETKQKVFKVLERENYRVDVILSHTCPLRYEPIEWFLGGIDQDTVDRSTEKFLDDIEASTHYKRWFCGHFHGEKKIDKIQFLFKSILTFL